MHITKHQNTPYSVNQTVYKIHSQVCRDILGLDSSKTTLSFPPQHISWRYFIAKIQFFKDSPFLILPTDVTQLEKIAPRKDTKILHTALKTEPLLLHL